MQKLGFKKAEELEIKLPTFPGSQRKQGNSRIISTSASLTTLKPLTVEDHNKLGKILKEIEIPDLLTYLLRNLYADQEATVRMLHGKMDWFKIGTEQDKAVYCHPVYFTSKQSTPREMLVWMTHKLESRYADDMQICR